MTGDLVPRMNMQPLAKSRCDICGKGRSSGNHDACSRERQRKWASKWQEYEQEKEAAHRSQRKRYAR